MNRTLYRLIFNAARGCLMAVAEVARSCGKAASGEGGGSSGASHGGSAAGGAGLGGFYMPNGLQARVNIAQAPIKTIAFAAALLCTGWGGSAWAQAVPATAIVVNTAAPAAQQPVLTTTASGIPQVNIQTAVGGVSRNQYTQFDVGANGLILNNSAVNSNTRLAGWVAGNTNLATGSANIILNEVSSANPSLLRGYIEVAGQKAEVVIANPAGISVNGGGFINASGATLTTGTPQFSGNTLTGYQVGGGTITVSGTGLDTANTGITTLQARQIILQGAVHAQDLRVNADNSGGTANAVAIDVAAIGGMYANKITILATGAGAGVNNAGTLQANSGNFTLSADGILTNTGTLNSTGTTRVNATTVNNGTAGAIYGGSVAVAATTLNNAAASATDTAPVIAARDAAGRVDLGVQTLNNQEGALIYSAGSLAVGGALDANGQATGRAITVTNNSATLEAAGNVDITTQTLANTYSSLAYRVLVDTSRTGGGSESCGDRCTHSWTDTFYKAEAIEGPNGAAIIRAGGNITLDASISALNSSSQILAAGSVTTVPGSASLVNQGIDLTTQVATKRDHHVAQGYTDNEVGCWFDFGFKVGCHSEERTRHSYSTSYSANDQTVKPATSQQYSAAPSTTSAPNSALFAASNNNHYLIQTNPAFTNKQIWLSSDYMLQALNVDPDTVQKRLGDGFYEQRLINEQVARLTGYTRLANYASDEAQYQGLMNAGVTFAKAHQLRPGIALTAEQVASLTSDIVWLETQEITLPGVNGQPSSKQTVLVPRLYALARAGDLDANGQLLGGLIAANTVNLHATGDISNRHASIQGRELVQINAANINNLAGRIEAKTLTLGASQDITNTGGAFIAEQALAANAGRDLKVSTTTLDSTQGASNATAATSITGKLGGTSSAGLQVRSTNISRVAGLYVTGNAGTLLASAGRDADLVGALLQSQGSANVSAARNLNLATVTTSASMDATMDGGNYNRTSRSAEVGSSVQSAGATTLSAGNNLSARAADVQALGTLSASAGNSVRLEAGQSTNNVESMRTTKNSGFLSSSTRTERSSQSSTEAIASNFGGGNVTVTSGQDIGVKASNVNAAQDLSLQAGRDVVIESGQTTASSSAYSKLTESGLSGDIMSGASFGESMQAQAATSHTTTQVASTVSARNVSIQSTRDTTVAASNVLADQDISVVAGGKVNILAAANTQTSTQQSESHSTQVGLGGGLSGRVSLYADTQTQGNGSNTVTSQSTSVLSANGGKLSVTANGGALTTQGADLLAADTVTLQGKTVDLQAIADQQTSANHFESRSVTVGSALSGTVGSLITAIGDNVQLANTTKNERLKNAASLKAGYDAYKFVNGGALDKLSQAGSAAGSANGDPSGSAIGVSISVGVSSSSQDSASASTQVRGTNAQAKTINITATEGDLSATAAKLQADDISLEAAQNITLQAGANTSTVSSRNDSSNTGAGVTFGVGQQSGLSFQLSASQANGRANGSETTYDNTQVTASKTLRVKSGTDTTLAGAQLAADSVQMDVGTSGTGKLNIQTLQSSSTYSSEQHSSGFSVSICIPPICYGGVPVTGSIQQSEQSFNHNYQSAVGQSGIAAGAGGFDIKVAGNTDLKGGAITSSATPDKNTLQTASLTSTDLDNRQATHSSSSSTNLSYSGASTLATLAQNAISNGLGNLGAGEGLPENGSQSSTTRSVISAGNITITGTGNKGTDAASQQQVATLTSRDATTANQTLSNTLTLQQAQALQDQQKTAQENAQAGQLVGSVAFNVVGDIAQKNGWKDSSPQKIALHTIAGFIQASAAGQNGASGALAAMGNEALTRVVNEAIDKALPMPENATPEQQREVNLSRKALAESAASLLGATTVALAGGSKQQIAQGGAVALNADRFNRQLHQTEAEKLSKLKEGKTTEQKRRLDAAACALVECASGVPENDPNYQKLAKMQSDGAQYTNELRDLRATGEFVYGPLDPLRDRLTRNGETLQRVGGGVNLVAGAVGTVAGGAMVAGGAATCIPTTGAGCAAAVVGVGIAGLSNQQAQDGNKALFGPYTSTEGQRVLDSFNIETYPGERDPLTNAAIDAGKLAITAAIAKYVPRGLAAAEGLEIKATTTGPIVNGQMGNGQPINKIVYNGVELDSSLPPPVAGYDYAPTFVKGATTDNAAYAHLTGFQTEVKLANDVAGQGQAVVKWGDKIGNNGSDVISVNPKTGEVVLWDSKYRTGTTSIAQSPTFADEITRNKAIREAQDAIKLSNLPPDVQAKALQNLTDKNFTTNTVGAGGVKNSVQVRYCGNKPC